MSRLAAAKLQPLRFVGSQNRLNSARLVVADPLSRMSGNCLTQRRGLSYFSGANAYVDRWAKPHKEVVPAFRIHNYNNNNNYPIVRGPALRIQKTESPSVRGAFANGNRAANASNYRPSSQAQGVPNSTRPLESWKLWQKMNFSIKDIGLERGLSELQVYEQICECVRQGNDIDWFDLCREAGFSRAIVAEINDAKARAEEAVNVPLGQRLDELGRVPVQCGLHVTDVHILLYNTMMACGITPHEVLVLSMDAVPSLIPEKLPAPAKAPLVSKTTDKSASVGVVPAYGTLSTSGDKNLSAEEADTKKAPKRLTQKHMLQWMTDRDGVSLLELVTEFQGYNECQLMRLILLLERKKLIQLSQGVFRVTTSDEEAPNMR